ncbi:hypothetical protein Droror1_Dr00000205 [Drosera rotundifolia]
MLEYLRSVTLKTLISLAGSLLWQKRVRFPKGKKARPGAAAVGLRDDAKEDAKPKDWKDPQQAAKDRARRRSQMSTKLLADEDEQNLVDISQAEDLHEGFVKSLLDVADNLGRASSAVKENFAKIDAATDTTGAVPLLKTLLEGVEMTERQLLEIRWLSYLILLCDCFS